MAGSVGGIACDIVRGTLPAQKERSEVWQVPGINGFGIALLGYGESETDITAAKYSTNAGVNTWAGNVQALQGTVGVITTDAGDSYAYCFFQKVEIVSKIRLYIPGSATTYREEVKIRAILL